MNIEFEYIAFDLGGVLIELNGFSQLMTGTSDLNIQKEFWQHWSTSNSVKAFETGKLSFEEFVLDFLKETNSSIPENEFIKNFTKWPNPPALEVMKLLEYLVQKWRLLILSNNNEVILNKILNQWGFKKYFYKVYSSHIIGKLKPDLEFFKFVISDLHVLPNRILFLDDNNSNIIAAKKMGFHAENTNGIDDIYKILINYKIVSTEITKLKTYI